MNRWLRIAVTAVVLGAIALGVVLSVDTQRADATTSRPAAPLLSARSAGLAAQHGMVSLNAVGMPSRDAATGLLQRGGDRSRPGLTDSWNTVQDLVGELCSQIDVKIDVWVTDVDISGFLQGICKVLGGGLLGIWKIAADLTTTVVLKIFQPLFAWVMKVAIGGAIGYDAQCANVGASAPATCTGADTSNRILKLPQLDTSKAILSLSLLMAVPLLVVAIISALAKLSFAELGKSLLRLPIIWIVAGVAIVIIAATAGIRDGMVTFIVNQSHMMDNIEKFMNADSFFTYTAYEEGILQILALLASVIGGILLFIIFMVGDIVVLATALFIPLAAVGLLWSGTAKWFKRVVELSFAFIIGKVVVVGILALSFDLLVNQ